MIEMDAFLASALAASAIAAWFDWRTGEIPNWVSYGPLAMAPFVHLGAAAGHGGGRLAIAMAGMSVLGAFVCGLVPFLFWRKGATGGGDVKMLAAVGALLLPMCGIEAELYAFIAAAVFAPARMAWDGKLLRTLGNTAALAMNPFLPRAKRREVPIEAMTELRFAPAIFVGVALTALLHWRGR